MVLFAFSNIVIFLNSLEINFFFLDFSQVVDNWHLGRPQTAESRKQTTSYQEPSV
jgi:hypothetical protein